MGLNDLERMRIYFASCYLGSWAVQPPAAMMDDGRDHGSTGRGCWVLGYEIMFWGLKFEQRSPYLVLWMGGTNKYIVVDRSTYTIGLAVVNSQQQQPFLW